MIGFLVPAENLIWQDPVPKADHPLVDASDIASLKAKILATGVSVSDLVFVAWSSASTFRGSDKRGGANVPAEEMLVDKAQLLTLSAPEMTVLVGGLRVLGANTGSTSHGVFTDRKGTLVNYRAFHDRMTTSLEA